MNELQDKGESGRSTNRAQLPECLQVDTNEVEVVAGCQKKILEGRSVGNWKVINVLRFSDVVLT